MSTTQPLRPALVVNRLFMQAFLAADAPCLALGMVEGQQRLCGMLALRLDEAIPAAIADRGFEFGHALFGNDDLCRPATGLRVPRVSDLQRADQPE